MDDNELLNKCLQDNETALTELYKRFSSKMYGICLRYAKNRVDAQDLLHDGFVKVMETLKTYRNEGSFEGLLRKIMVNTAINFYTKKHMVNIYSIDEIVEEIAFDDNAVSKLSENELLSFIEQLPDGYRLVFNLYVIDGYNHHEIADFLNISPNTSKTQLMKARWLLAKKIMQTNKEENTGYFKKRTDNNFKMVNII